MQHFARLRESRDVTKQKCSRTKTLTECFRLPQIGFMGWLGFAAARCWRSVLLPVGFAFGDTNTALGWRALFLNKTGGANTARQLGVKASSARYKEAIKPMDKSSEALLNLKPVTFRYKKELDPKGVRQFGLVAEEVAKVDPDLVELDAKGKPFTVRYDQVNAMLLNEFLKEHRKVKELQAIVTRLEATVNEQAAQIERVGSQVQASQTTPRLVENR